ncbi:hypothetical protein E2493_16110 [Sphingomonas parva]|uniref:Uncharacterized protein n=1 Tax=Sphingomonas parva TaxID=2555898 RepID=A0A4Y8ZMK4_9SPHN|nr:hypothetical protein [Sphingomonas parva]TFI57228.1 hypothetical protein E2493_16110 [Sphingomonas parva]
MSERRIPVGPYELVVPEECVTAYRVSVSILEKLHVPWEDFDLEIDGLLAEFDQGYIPEDAVAVTGEPDTYAFTRCGVRLHIRIDQGLMDLVVVRIQPPSQWILPRSF